MCICGFSTFSNKVDRKHSIMFHGALTNTCSDTAYKILNKLDKQFRRAKTPNKLVDSINVIHIRNHYLGQMRVGVESTLVADLVLTLCTGIEVWLVRRGGEICCLAYRAERATWKGGNLRD